MDTNTEVKNYTLDNECNHFSDDLANLRTEESEELTIGKIIDELKANTLEDVKDKDTIDIEKLKTEKQVLDPLDDAPDCIASNELKLEINEEQEERAASPSICTSPIEHPQEDEKEEDEKERPNSLLRTDSIEKSEKKEIVNTH